MISCTEFIAAYSELFKYLESAGGREAVEDFWRYLSDTYLTELKHLVEKQGLRGCWTYWSKALNEEAADFMFEMDEEAGDIRCIMYHCPSKGRLLEWKHIEPYHDYCRHCDVMYRLILEPSGFEHIMDLSECDKARCTSIITDKKKHRRNPR